MTKPFTPLASALALTLALASTAQADAYDFQGFYGGVELGTGSLDANFGLPLQTGTSGGLFVGYNHALNSDVVIGGELSYGFDADHQIAPGVDFTIEGPTELRARLGYVTGNTMIYAALGYTWADYTQTGVPFSDSFEGMSYGLGLETLLTENISLRLDYTRTSYEPGGTIYPTIFDFDSDVVSLGIAYHF